MIDWRDIETAPKDGTAILIYVDDVAIEAAWDDQTRADGSSFGAGKWRVESVSEHGCGCCADENGQASHWAILNRPTQKEGQFDT